MIHAVSHARLHQAMQRINVHTISNRYKAYPVHTSNLT